MLTLSKNGSHSFAECRRKTERNRREKLMQKILTSLEIDCFIDIRSIFRSHGLSFPIELRCFVLVSGWISMSQLIRLRRTWNMMKVVKKYRKINVFLRKMNRVYPLQNRLCAYQCRGPCISSNVFRSGTNTKYIYRSS